MLRNFFAVVAGYLTMVVLVNLVTFLLQAVFPAWFRPGTPPPPPYIALDIVYSFGAAFVGGWTAARIASSKRLQTAIVLAAVTCLLGLVPIIFGLGMMPRWMAVVPAVVMPLGIVAGGWLRARASEVRAA